ncbi:MAG: transporter permease, partial [Chitinophagaceae bacterium]|nr:transporter permease [Chitinophagaceae bacterium]
MIKNYLIIAMRNFWRHKVFSIINISGLSIGISAALIIFLIVSYEFSFEKFQKDGNRIYRVVSDATFPGGSEFKCSGVPMPMPVALRNDLPGIETASHFVTIYQAKATIPFTGSQSPAEFKKQKNIIYADEFYFSLFKYEWLAGSEQTALKDPFQVVITESKAKLYFGNIPASEVIGRQIIYNDSIKTMVSGIVKDLDDKATDFRFTEFISFPTMIKTGIDNQFGGEFWGSINSASQLFLKLEKGTAAKKIESQLPALRKKYNKDIREGKDDTYNHLQSLTDIHFNQDYDAFDQRQAHKPTMYGLLAVGTFLLLLGCINFINLTTARSALRAKEIGIRKTAGSSKMQLICQFLSETFVLTVMAAIFSLVLIPSLLKVFHDFIPPEINSASVNQPPVWIFLSLLVLAITFLSGFYPALVLTKFQPVRVLKNQVYTGTSKNSQLWLRKSLTVTQFVIAQFLVIATLVVSKQVHYSLNKDLGYKKDAIVYFNTPRNFFSDKKDDRRFALLERLKSFPEIDKVSLAQSSPASESTGSATIKVNNGKEDVEINVEQKNGDPDYFDIYKMKLVAGKWPQKSDTLKEYLINETFARSLGFSKPGEAVGHFVDA